jgi:hypothetical protein
VLKQERHVKELSQLKAASAKHRPKFAARQIAEKMLVRL